MEEKEAKGGENRGGRSRIAIDVARIGSTNKLNGDNRPTGFRTNNDLFIDSLKHIYTSQTIGKRAVV